MAVESIFIETTIPSYYTARKPQSLVQQARQELTIEWWNLYRSKYKLFTSEVVIGEVSRGEDQMASSRLELICEIPRLSITDLVEKVAIELVKENIVPHKAADDALHIACAGVHRIDYLLTWNCTHIANPHIRKRIRKCFIGHNLPMPVICTPEELIGDAY